MKTPPKTIAARYIEWLNTRWSPLTGRLPDLPTQEWEGEGGAIEPAEKPGTAPAPKIPL